jgi:hypothetical protein
MSIERRIQPDERYRFGWCCDQDFENGTYRTTPECIRETAADRVAVRRAGLKALLRQVDPGGFWSRDLGIRYRPGSDEPIPIEVQPDTGTEALRAAIERAYAEHDEHRARHPDHQGTCQDARPHPADLARALRAQPAAVEEPHACTGWGDFPCEDPSHLSEYRSAAVEEVTR